MQNTASGVTFLPLQSSPAMTIFFSRSLCGSARTHLSSSHTKWRNTDWQFAMRMVDMGRRIQQSDFGNNYIPISQRQLDKLISIAYHEMLYTAVNAEGVWYI